MPPVDDTRENHILGDQTRVLAVRSDASDQREWIASSPMVSSLADFGIAHCGIMNAMPPFEITRSRLNGTFFFSCFDGEGQVLIDGDWRGVTSGQACVQPPFITNAVKAVSKIPWGFCWIRFRATSESRPRVSLHAPAIAAFVSSPLRFAIEGLHSEACGAASPHALTKWCDLIHHYFSDFTAPFRDSRLVPLWDQVESHLGDEWTLNQLAEMAGISKEHLRRLCTQSLGRSPIQHIAYLRMHHAAELLVTTEDSIGKIAEKVGYANQFSFSDTFKRWLGCRPSSYRRSRH